MYKRNSGNDGKSNYRSVYDWHIDSKVASTQTSHLLTRLPALSMGTHIADFPVLPFPLQRLQLLFTLVHGLCNCIEDKVTNDTLRYSIAMILFSTDSLHDSLSLSLVRENNKKIALIREVKLQRHIAEEKCTFVVLDNFIVRPTRFSNQSQVSGLPVSCHIPAMTLLVISVQLNKCTGRNRQDIFLSILCVDDLSTWSLNQSVNEVKILLSQYKKTS